jgi:hypothetical protein
MKAVRDVISVSITLVLVSFIGLSLARLVYFFLHSQQIL